jgi:uncharacterized protein
MTKVIITGGNGNVGKHLSSLLQKNGMQVGILTRKPQKGALMEYYWDPAKMEIDPSFLQDIDYIFHLAGAGVADKKWTSSYKAEILESRVNGTRLIAQALTDHAHQVKSVVSASAVGIYGTHPNGLVKEDYPAADNFLADVCVQWEKEAQKISSLGIPLSIIRIGIVLNKEGGFIKEIGNLAKFGLAAPLGNGKMMVPWIHVEDLCRMFLFLAKHPENQGIYNGVAPHPESNKALTKYIAKALHRPMLLPPVPGFALKLMMGEMGGMLLSDQNISSEKIQDAGFGFKFLHAKDAIQEILR